MRVRTFLAGLAGAALLAAAAPAIPAGVPAAAQDRAGPASPAPRPFAARSGVWLGLGFRDTGGRSDGEGPLQIVAVFPGGPAAEAGLRPGDVLVRFAGQDADPATVRAVLSGARPGQEIELRVRRDGRVLERRVRAGERPQRPPAPDGATFPFRIDSVAHAVVESLDSLRRAGAPIPHLREGWAAAAAEAPAGWRGSGHDGAWTWTRHGTPIADGVEVSVGEPVPFSVFLVDSERMERIREQIEGLAGRVEELQRRRAALEASGASDARQARAEAERLRAEETALRAAMEQTRERLRRTADRELREVRVRALRAAEGAAPGRPGRVRITVPATPAPPAPPIAPRVVGHHFLAGAEMVTLNPDLAGYFGAERGVLVTRVPAGTPADEAGLTPGDVIVRVEGAPVGSLDELRDRMSDPSRRTLTVIRRSEEVRIRLRP